VENKFSITGEFEPAWLADAHKHSIFNREEILQSKLCGCFYCLEIFTRDEVVDWTDEELSMSKTALCPKCGIDSVLGDSSGFPAGSKDFLKAMHYKYFQ
jgi:hypothetical protein